MGHDFEPSGTEMLHPVSRGKVVSVITEQFMVCIIIGLNNCAASCMDNVHGRPLVVILICDHLPMWKRSRGGQGTRSGIMLRGSQSKKEEQDLLWP